MARGTQLVDRRGSDGLKSGHRLEYVNAWFVRDPLSRRQIEIDACEKDL